MVELRRSTAHSERTPSGPKLLPCKLREDGERGEGDLNHFLPMFSIANVKSVQHTDREGKITPY